MGMQLGGQNCDCGICTSENVNFKNLKTLKTRKRADVKLLWLQRKTITNVNGLITERKKKDTLEIQETFQKHLVKKKKKK